MYARVAERFDEEYHRDSMRCSGMSFRSFGGLRVPVLGSRV